MERKLIDKIHSMMHPYFCTGICRYCGRCCYNSVYSDTENCLKDCIIYDK